MAAATDLAEVIGGAIALHLLLGLPLLTGGCLIGAVSMLLLALQERRSQRTFEGVVVALLVVVTIGFVGGLVVAPPDWSATAAGLIPRLQEDVGAHECLPFRCRSAAGASAEGGPGGPPRGLHDTKIRPPCTGRRRPDARGTEPFQFNNTPVSQLIIDRAGPSMQLDLQAMLLGTVLGTFLGVISAEHHPPVRHGLHPAR